MKLKFKHQPYQENAVQAVIDCFKGQPNIDKLKYRVDPGMRRGELDFNDDGFKNADFVLNEQQLLANIQAVQHRQNLPISDSLKDFKTIKKGKFQSDPAYAKKAQKICPLHLDIEMETGTGKTYCYIKSIFEMNKLYGWSKFIIVVPSIAIREGVAKSFEITADHFQQDYGKKAKPFIYNSKQLHNLESFSSDAGVNVMIINVQAFNARGKDNRRIYDELDDFQSRKPIDVIKANRPILILDEPQKMEGAATLESLENFNPLMIHRYSATHKSLHNKIHRLDALDAYNQKLVKKIAVRGISVKGLSGTNAYLYLESIEVSLQAPVARLELEIKQGNGIKRVIRKLGKGDNLYTVSNELDQYKGFTISDINAVSDTVSFSNGKVITAGEATGDVSEMTLRRIQIRETIKSHLEKEKALFDKGIKVLSLFFIDEVAKYRKYTEAGEELGGEYAQIFEEEYESCLADAIQDLFISEAYRKYLENISAKRTHNGYFSVDKKGRAIDSTETGRGEDRSCDDVDAYDLILKKKEILLSFGEPTRFIFSHSALREGWDNPNVFVICTLKHSDNTISRRQEVGRGLRISVNQLGERQDDPATVHQTNVLTVVANESYSEFVTGLQKDISESLSERPRIADVDYFAGKVMLHDGKEIEVDRQMAKLIYKYLVKNDYTDSQDHVSEIYHNAVKTETLAPLPDELKPYQQQVFQLIDSVYSDAKLPLPDNDRGGKTNLLNDNFNKKEFKELWGRINKKAVYTVHFNSEELIQKCVKTLDKDLNITPLLYTIQAGQQTDLVNQNMLENGQAFKLTETKVEASKSSIYSAVKYDIVGKIAEAVKLTRKTVAQMLSKIQKATFDQFKMNPESFLAEAIRLINEQKATVIIEHLAYDMTSQYHDIDIFTKNQSKQDFSKAGDKLKRHVYDYVVTDSDKERDFVTDLDTSSDVVVYAKLPRGFYIPTPVGNYNPDWAIAFVEGSVKHVYFVAETKGSMSSMELREVEKARIECARKFFDEINRKINPENVKYDVVDSFGKLMELVK